MNKTWKSNLGKLLLGGCGTQVGLVFASVALAGFLLLCFVVAVSSVLGIAVAQEAANLSANATAEAASDTEVLALQGEIESLVSQVEVLQNSEPVVLVPTAAPLPQPKAFVIATKNGVNLRSGPGANRERVGTLSLGGRLEIVGRNGDSSWWLVATPDGLAWVSAEVVLAYDVNDSIPVVTIPALLTWPTTDRPNDPPAGPANTPTPDLPANPAPARPSATPTATVGESRIFVEDTVGWKRIFEQLLNRPPVSASFSPRGDRIAIIDGIKLYLVAGDASYGQILFAEDETLRPFGGAVWSPDGKYIAFVVDSKEQKCRPCRSVALARVSDGSISFLETRDQMDSEAPRWTHDGRLLVLVHPHEPADGVTYVYDTSGRGQVAKGIFVLSSSQEGQKWLPWRPGRVWQAGVSERADTYYNN
jgi:hypothetical protein